MFLRWKVVGCCFGSFWLLIGLTVSRAVSASAYATKRHGGPRGSTSTRRGLWVQQVSRISTIVEPVAFKKEGPSKYYDDDWDDEDDDYDYDDEYPTLSPTKVPAEDASGEASPAPFTYPPLVTLDPSELGSSDTASPTAVPMVPVDHATTEATPAPFTYPPLVTFDPSELDSGNTAFPTMGPTMASDNVGIAIPSPSSGSADDLVDSFTSVPTGTPVSISMPQEEDQGEVSPPSNTTSSMASQKAACDAAERGDVYVTATSQTVEFQYELLTTAGSSLTTITTLLDSQYQDFLATTLVDCSLTPDNPDVQGVDTAFRSTVMDTPCTKIQFFDSSLFVCYQIKSAVNVYLSQTTTMTSLEVQNEVYQTMSDAINGPTRRRLGQRRLFTSSFSDATNDIVDLYFLNTPTPKVSEVARSADQVKASQGISGEALLGSFMGFGLLTLAVIGLIWYKRRKDRDNNKSNVYSQKDSIDHGYGAILDPSLGPTPSPLSVPPERSSYSINLPATSLFEAYEAVHMDDGNQLFYRTVTTSDSPQVPRTRIRIQEMSTVGHERPDPSRTDRSCDELLMTPPPFLHKIPRPKALISGSVSSRRDDDTRLQSLVKKRDKSVDPPPSTRNPYYIDFDAQPTHSEAESTDTYGMTKLTVRHTSKSMTNTPGRYIPSSGRLSQDEDDSSDAYTMPKNMYTSRSVMSTPGSKARSSGRLVLDDEDSSDTYGMTKSMYHSKSIFSTPSSQSRSTGRLALDEYDSSDTYGMTKSMYHSRSIMSIPGSHIQSLGRLVLEDDDSSDADRTTKNITRSSRSIMSSPGSMSRSSRRLVRDEDDSSDPYGMAEIIHTSKSIMSSTPSRRSRSLGRPVLHQNDSPDTYGTGQAIYDPRTTVSTSSSKAQSSGRLVLDEGLSSDTHGNTKQMNASRSIGSSPRIGVRSSERPVHSPQTPQTQSSDDDRLNMPSKAPQEDDSFNVSGFLSGHCSTIEGFYDPDRRVPADKKIEDFTSKKQSPTTLAEFWSDSSAMSPVRVTARSSVRGQSPDSLGTGIGEEESSCSSGHKGELSSSTDGVNMWCCDNVTDYFHNFTPYGSNQYPSMEDIVGKGSGCNTPSTASLSTFITPSNGRGRDPTPVVQSTNSQPDKRRSKRSSTLAPKNPPARLATRVATFIGLGGPPSRDATRSLSRSRTPHRSSSSRGPPVPRFRRPSRGVETHSSRRSASDTVHL